MLLFREESLVLEEADLECVDAEVVGDEEGLLDVVLLLAPVEGLGVEDGVRFGGILASIVL